MLLNLHRRWTAAEHERLLVLIKRYRRYPHTGGRINWAAVASRLQTRSAKQCRAHWERVIQPHEKQRQQELHPWYARRCNHLSYAEINKCYYLLAICSGDNDDKGSHNENAGATASIAGVRVHEDGRTLVRQSVRKEWTGEQDELLRAAVAELGERNWVEVARRVPGRTAVQVRERWVKRLRGGFVRGLWYPDEDHLLLCAIDKCGAGTHPLMSRSNR